MKNLNLLCLFIACLTIIMSCDSDTKSNQVNTKSNKLQIELDSLHGELTRISQETVIPGFAATLIKGKEVIYSEGFGYSDLLNKHAFSPQTVHVIASLSKTFVGVAIMKLVEDGMLKLDDPINNFLPFEIVNPKHPETVITIRHLVTHTSSLNDDFDDGEKRPSQLLEQSRYSEDEMPAEMAEDIYYWDGRYLALEDYLEQIFRVGGKWYDEENFSDFKPGEQYEYSNEGSNLAGLIVERISGMPFADFTQKYIFEPLKMENSSWVYSDLDSTISKLYVEYENNGQDEIFEFPRAIDSGQPCGDLKSNSDDLSKYIIEMMKGFNGKGKILNAQSYQTLLNSQQSRSLFDDKDQSAMNDEYDVGVFWAISQPGLRLHKGGSIGVFSIFYFDPTVSTGVVAYCNMAHPDFGEIVNTLRVFEQKIASDIK